jgi:hypothetical protein
VGLAARRILPGQAKTDGQGTDKRGDDDDEREDTRTDKRRQHGQTKTTTATDEDDGKTDTRRTGDEGKIGGGWRRERIFWNDGGGGLGGRPLSGQYLIGATVGTGLPSSHQASWATSRRRSCSPGLPFNTSARRADQATKHAVGEGRSRRRPEGRIIIQ